MQKKISIIVGVIVALLIIALPYIKYNQKAKMIEENIEDLRTPIVSLTGDISRLEIKDETVFVLQKGTKRWIEPEAVSLNYDNEQVNHLVRELLTLQSKQVIYNVQDVQKYGVSEFSRMITVYNKENSSQTIIVGGYTADKLGCYVWSVANEKMYIVNSEDLKPLLGQKEELIDQKMIVPGADTVERLKIVKKGQKSIVIQKNQEIGYKGYENWLIKDFFKNSHQLQTETVEALLAQVGAFEKEKFVSATVDKDQYGLKDPEISLSINGEWQIDFGKNEGGYVYFTYNQEPYVYKMSEEKVRIFSGIKPMEMIRKQVYLPKVEQITQIELVNPQQTFTVHIIKNEMPAVFYTSQLQDVALNVEKTRELVELIGNGVCIEMLLQNPEIEQKEERKAEVTLTYQLEDGSTKLIELIPYDINFYVLRIDGAIEFAVSKQPVMNLFNQMSEMIK